MLTSLLTALHVVVCALLVAAVLMQQGKGGDIAAAFGGSGSQTAFGARAGATVLTRATTVLGALFMIGSMSLAIMGSRGTSSVLSGVEGPGLQPVAPLTAPAEVDPAPETPTEESAEEPADPPAEPQ
ncbi:MAG: preprotein translocase subunit SecG [Vicinamibacterales bacterium]|jgi:preprotein translocase subunit SecG|nr:preprotein translocase subunit SecG [Vicinamibacterales bacterium]